KARTADYEELLRTVKKARLSTNSNQVSRLRKKFEEIAAIDFFNSPLRSRVEAILSRSDPVKPADSKGARANMKKKYTNRVWVTRPRPGIDRVSSAWLIRRFIDRNASFAFSHETARLPDAVPFDTFQPDGFGHRGDDCSFETLRKEFGIRE